MLRECYKIDTGFIQGSAILWGQEKEDDMPDIKTRLSTLLIQYRYTQSKRVLQQMVSLVEQMDNARDGKSFEDFFLSSLS